MANSEQEDILDRLVHIYECDEQHVSALIIPTDGEIREDLPVYIEDAESDTIYATTTTDTYGMINTTFSLSPGTHTPTIKCGSNKHNIYDTSVVCHACSLTLTSDKDILSATDGDIATLTATLIGTESGYNGPLSGREVAFEIYQASDDTFIETLTATTNSSGVATVSYSSQGIGDISIVAKVGSLLIQTYAIEDCIYYGAMTSDDGHWTYPSASVSYSSQGCKITGTNWADAPCNVTFTKPVSLKWSVTTSPTNTFYISIKDNGTNIFTGQIISDKVVIDTPSAQTFNGKGGTGDYEFKFKDNGTVEFYKNNVYVGSTTYTGTPTSFNWGYGGSRNMTVKDFMIKPL